MVLPALVDGGGGGGRMWVGRGWEKLRERERVGDLGFWVNPNDRSVFFFFFNKKAGWVNQGREKRYFFSF
jgi:hypothetical protein